MTLGVVVASFGPVAIAVQKVGSQIESISWMTAGGFASALTAFTGQNYGAKKYDRVREGFWFCVKYAFVFLIIVAAAGIVFAQPIITIFRKDDADVIRIGTLALRLQCISFPLMAWTVMCTMLTQTMGLVGPASFLSLARQGLFFIPVVIGVPHLIAWAFPAVLPILGVQMAQPIADIATAVVSVPVCIRVMRKYLLKDAKNT